MKKPGKIIRNWFHQISSIKAYLFWNKTKFMNLGYADEYSARNRDYACFQRNLYLRLICKAKEFFPEGRVNGALEIGCGRGGGCQLLSHELNTVHTVGLDRVFGNVLIARRQFRDVEFVKADACNFNLHRKFDVVLNLESAHAYSDLPGFVNAVKQHLNSGGVFAFGDLMSAKRRGLLLNLFHEVGFSLVNSENISSRVIDSLQLRAKFESGLVFRFPKLFPSIVHNFFVTTRSRAFRKLTEGKSNYFLMVFQYGKKDNVGN